MSVLPVPQIDAIEFVKKMFLARGYLNTAIMLDQHLNKYVLYADTPSHQRAMCIFADCKIFGDSMDVGAFDPMDTHASDSAQIGDKCKVNPNQNTGMDFVKSVIRFAVAQDVRIVILVTDFLTSHALKHIRMEKSIQFSHFSYNETGVRGLSSHIYQPVTYEALSMDEKQIFIAKNPRYKQELPRYSVHDALVKYYGMQVGDVIRIEDNDRQTGLVEEFALIVE